MGGSPSLPTSLTPRLHRAQPLRYAVVRFLRRLLHCAIERSTSPSLDSCTIAWRPTRVSTKYIVPTASFVMPLPRFPHQLASKGTRDQSIVFPTRQLHVCVLDGGLLPMARATGFLPPCLCRATAAVFLLLLLLLLSETLSPLM